MREDEFATLLARGYETRGVEFKGPRPRSSKAAFAQVVRAVLGMANHQDGGQVIIGVDDAAAGPEPTGLTALDLASWNYDHVAVGIDEYASPSVSFDLERLVFDSKNFVILQVYEFDDIPILCNKEYQKPGAKPEIILRKGGCYVRSRHKPETSEIPTHQEMRALLDLAIRKGVNRWVKQAYEAGFFPAGAAATTPPSDRDLFREQLRDF